MLLERMGRYGEAEKRFEEINDHYGYFLPLISFYDRRAGAGDMRYAARPEAALMRLFPAGMEKASLADFSGAPTDGVVIRRSSDEMTEVGLRANDIVVGLDGRGYTSRDTGMFTHHWQPVHPDLLPTAGRAATHADVV